jgi:hypothetical protein
MSANTRRGLPFSASTIRNEFQHINLALAFPA